MNRYWSAFLLVLLWASTVIATDNVSGRITGAWIPYKIGPISGGKIYAFNINAGPSPQRDRPTRVPDGVALTNAEGKFTLELAEGTYYLSTRKNLSGDAPGPPQEGDLYGLIRDGKGELVRYTVKRGKTTDIGILRQASVFKSRALKYPADMTAITGTVKTFDGTPVAGAVVQVYDNGDVKGKPLYVSQQTGKDGQYVVQVGTEGTYFLSSRGGHGGGRLRAGDLLGVYGGDAAKPVMVKKHGITKDIDIQVGQFVDNRPE